MRRWTWGSHAGDLYQVGLGVLVKEGLGWLGGR